MIDAETRRFVEQQIRELRNSLKQDVAPAATTGESTVKIVSGMQSQIDEIKKQIVIVPDGIGII